MLRMRVFDVPDNDTSSVVANASSREVASVTSASYSRVSCARDAPQAGCLTMLPLFSDRRWHMRAYRAR
jgi:hypothetical protein